MWRAFFTKQARKDAKKLSSLGLRQKAEKLLDILRENPYQTPPPFEKLIGDLAGAYSRRVNIQHRLVYQVKYLRQSRRLEILEPLKAVSLWAA